MLDTVTMFIHDIGDKNLNLNLRGTHKPLVQILKSKASSRVEFQNFDLDSKEDIEQPYILSGSGHRKKRIPKATIHRDMLFFEQTGRAVERFAIIGDYMPSSNYKIRYVIDYSQNFIKVEFSIPKYFFGTNILQTGDNPFSVNWSPFDSQNNTLEAQFGKAYAVFVSYIKKFFDVEFTGATIDYSKVKFRRLDLCFNLVFDTKENALQYLEGMRGIRKTRQRLETTNQTNYETSIFLRNADYSFKCYHKGSEYLKFDAKEHQRYNIENKTKFFNTPELQAFADRILRFEMTFFSSYISKIFNRIVRTKKYDLVPYNRTFDNYRKIFNKIVPIMQNKVRWDEYRFNQKNIKLSDHVKTFVLTSTDPLMCPNYVAFLGIIERLKNIHQTNQGGKSYYEVLYMLAGLKYYKPKNDLKMLEWFHNSMSSYYGKAHDIYLKLIDNRHNDIKHNEFINHFSSSAINQFQDIPFGKAIMNEMVKRFLYNVNQFKMKNYNLLATLSYF